MIRVEYKLENDRDPFYIVVLDAFVYEELTHWEALARVKQLAKLGITDKVYDETYDAVYSVVNGKIVNLEMPKYFSEYEDRYTETFKGRNKSEPLVIVEDVVTV